MLTLDRTEENKNDPQKRRKENEARSGGGGNCDKALFVSDPFAVVSFVRWR